jgi:hypothetical protein
VTNNLLTISYITNEALIILENTLVFADKVNRQYSDEFAVKEAKIGATCNVRRPARYQGTFGPALNVEDTNETYVPVTLNYQFHVDVQFTTADLLLSMDKFKERVLAPMQATIANRVDSDGLYFFYQNTALAVGTPGVSPAAYKTFSDARALLAFEACPAGPKSCILDPLSMSSATDGIKGLFNPQAQIGEYVKNGMIAKNFAGLDWFEDQNVVSFTTGAQGGTPLLTANTGGAFLTTGWAASGQIQTNGWTNSTGVIKVGDIIQIAGVFPANPQSRTQYGNALKQFVVIPPFGYTQNPVGSATPGLAFAAGFAHLGHVQRLDRRVHELGRGRAVDLRPRGLHHRRPVPERGHDGGLHGDLSDHRQRCGGRRERGEGVPAGRRAPSQQDGARVRGSAAAARRARGGARQRP